MTIVEFIFGQNQETWNSGMLQKQSYESDRITSGDQG